METSKIDLNRVIISLSILLSAVIISGALIYTKSSKPESETQPERVVDIKLGDGPYQGDKNAPVKIVEFSDFQCPFCRVFWSETYPRLKAEYLDTGKAVLEYRDLPLSFHPLAQKSAEGARCAQDQGKFWEFHDKIYSEQVELGQNTIYYTQEDLRTWAQELGLNMDSFNSCLDSDKYKDDVLADQRVANEFGVEGTPTFFINGVRIIGARPFEDFQSIIESELNK